MKNTNKDIIIVGFALFAMFFGAGNLIFPPFLGLISGESWMTGFSGFILADVGLALLAIAAAAKCGGDVNKILGRAGKSLSKVVGIAIMICLGPLLAIPRTAATTFEMGVQPIIGNSVSPVIFSIIFFAIVLLLTIRPSKVVDIIGKVLTPALLVALALLIIKGIITPLGQISPDTLVDNVFSNGVSQGYQTMDALGAVALSTIIIASLHNKGYESNSEKVSLTIKAGIVAGIALCFVYGGLTFLGATISQNFAGQDISSISQASLIVGITEQLLGYPGKAILGIIVSLACLTTAIGLTSATGQYFTKITNNKLKYEVVVIVVCVFSAIVSNFGVDTIIKFSAPILDMVYPVTILLVITTLFKDQIKNDNAIKGAAYVTLIISVLGVVNSLSSTYGLPVHIPFLELLPFAKLGFNWIVPAIVGGIVGNFVKTNNCMSVEYE
ncbi:MULTISPECIES: branched-chain amino acid transport system II carrier protein [Paraclostridium]|uniref:Branched-chain amino acid transport system carrier protein n=1 Tax=Paraclostridium benzoelyticum TaxID=1629550 RepID=A0A0M3DHV9_9FIRM|nr:MULTISPECIES: branched-chain amino acid transport system II carrier protein [Paraclostridium]KKY01736.1 branched-chain amino acid transporter [Paraclostridium benzoelyticum]MCU9813828.1 branched-chain amino acid transport system II carrier protein [Paraclostridium sp. AKS73]MDM8129313.1 branched-chain amino acid transport system II carrier protein [Paraclostridium benzoelyticum]OXX83388.1 branched-chain amino acid transporter [Paraclostridium benzoelyticum]UOW67309.1 branched-chain amino ac